MTPTMKLRQVLRLINGEWPTLFLQQWWEDERFPAGTHGEWRDVEFFQPPSERIQ